MTTIGITGASGYVGSRVAVAADAAGHDIIALGRRPSDQQHWRPFDLATGPYAGLLTGLEVIVHCAYDLSLTRAEEVQRVNVEGTRLLAEAAAAAGVRFVLISSMSAYSGTRQLYGRAKLRSEQIAHANGGDAVRLGLVYEDGGGGGMIGSLRRLASLPVTPVIGRHASQFLVHVDDMARGVVALASCSQPVGVTPGLAHPEPVLFEDILMRLGKDSGRAVRMLPLPWRPVYAAMRLAELARLPLPLRADSILGLVRPATGVPRFDIWTQLGVSIRPFAGVRGAQ